MTEDSSQLNLYPHKIPQTTLKELVDAGTDIAEFCTQSKAPLLITDIHEVFPSLAQWTPAFLDEKVGHKLVEVNSSATAMFQEYHRPIQMSLNEYSRRISAESDSAERRLYLGSLGIHQFFPELEPELMFDTLLPKETKHSDLWYGPGGNTTGLHYDPFNNFFMQMFGQKRWLMTEPNSFLNLHPRSALSSYPKVSDFNPSNPDFEKFPRAKKVKFYDLTVHPGSVLFVPPYWWHQVSSFSTSISVSIWCKTGLLKAEWGALQLLPTHIKYFTKQIFLAKRH
jgi:hypothetical protein